jgi:threonine aldolase
MRTIDLRRDTITLPTEEMTRAAFAAELGDSVYHEDGEQELLEETAARVMGKEASLFVPSGTMGNLVSLLAHTRHGDEIIVEENAHIPHSETGGAAFVGGLMIRTVRGPDGAPDPQGVTKAIRKSDIHEPPTGLLCIESSHHRYGGIVPPLEKFAALRDIARDAGIPVHLDGARIFNAALRLGVEAFRIAAHADSVMFCLSKGLGAPVGSMICGSREFISRAARFRKMLGGGMRQTGWLAACGRVALTGENISLLAKDNDNALRLAEGIAGLPGLQVDPGRTHTNYAMITVPAGTAPRDALHRALETRGVLTARTGDRVIRCVTSRQVDAGDIESAVEAFRDASASIFS